MRNQDWEWTVTRYRAAYAALKAVEQAEPAWGAFWRTEQKYAIDQAKSLEASAPRAVEPSLTTPPPITPTRNPPRRLTVAAQQAFADGEWMHSLMLNKVGDWPPTRHRRLQSR